MLFQLTEEQQMIRQAARDFAVNECLPGVIERDEQQKFPKEQIEKLADLGFMGMMTDPKYNGGGMDSISYVLAMEEISKIDVHSIKRRVDRRTNGSKLQLLLNKPH